MSENNSYNVGDVVNGKVTGIQPYGAFVALNDTTQGLVHISEIAHGFVKDVNDHLAVGDEVAVKVLSVDEENGKISLSIKATQEAPAAEEKPKQTRKKERRPAAAAQQTNDTPAGFNSLKEKLEVWINQSAEREKLLKK